MSGSKTGLFSRSRQKPLAERVRPKALAEVVGQSHITGERGLLASMRAASSPSSLILWGPPGTGKTTIARLLAGDLNISFVHFSAVLGGVSQVREIVRDARNRDKATFLFVDEIHRFNRAQQDAFLPHVEDGTIVLVGATTENPSFSVNNALLSRTTVLRLKPLDTDGIREILARARIEEKLEGLVPEETLDEIARIVPEDARRALNILEQLIEIAASMELPVSSELLAEHLSVLPAYHDRSSDYHYDILSAFIKSMRASDPDAALYWMARLLHGGEDPRILTRRMTIFASEDIGNADPQALGIALDCARAVDMIGMPEARIILAQAVTYLASAPRSNSAYLAVDAAMRVAGKTGELPVPVHLRNREGDALDEVTEDYRYPHDFPGGVVSQTCLPEGLTESKFYHPGERGFEKKIKERMNWKAGTLAARLSEDGQDE